VPQRQGNAAVSRSIASRFAMRISGRHFMTRLTAYLNSLARDEEGQDLLEYALLVALIALVAVVAVTQAGEAVSTIFGNIADALTGAAG
jgi:pilus assembly protein Flp/PilA